MQLAECIVKVKCIMMDSFAARLAPDSIARCEAASRPSFRSLSLSVSAGAPHLISLGNSERNVLALAVGTVQGHTLCAQDEAGTNVGRVSADFLRSFPSTRENGQTCRESSSMLCSLRRRKVVPIPTSRWGGRQAFQELPRTASSTNFLCSDIQRAITDNYLIGRHPHVSRTVEIGRNNAVLRHARLCKCSVRLVGKPAEKAKKILKTELDVQCNLRSCNLQ